MLIKPGCWNIQTVCLILRMPISVIAVPVDLENRMQRICLLHITVKVQTLRRFFQSWKLEKIWILKNILINMM